MLNITYPDRKANIWERKNTKVTDVIEQARRRKWTRAGHDNSIRDNRRTSPVTTWKPYEMKILRGRPARWLRRIRQVLEGTIWQRREQDRYMWKQHADTFAQPLDTIICMACYILCQMVPFQYSSSSFPPYRRSSCRSYPSVRFL